MSQDKEAQEAVDEAMPRFRTMILQEVKRRSAPGESASILIVLDDVLTDLQSKEAEHHARWQAEGADPEIRFRIWKECIRRMRLENSN